MKQAKMTIAKKQHIVSHHIDSIGGSLPKFGTSVGLMIGKMEAPVLKRAMPLNKMLVPIRGTKKSREMG